MSPEDCRCGACCDFTAQGGVTCAAYTQFVRECFSSKETEPPVVIGGAVQGLLASNSSHVAGVSLFAAHMPGQQSTITE